MAKFKVHFESSCAVGVELEVEANGKIAAEAIAWSQWRDKDMDNAVATLIEVNEHACKGFAEAVGLDVSFMTVSLDSESGFEVTDVHTYGVEPPSPADDKLQRILALAKRIDDRQRDKELTPFDVAGELSDVVHAIVQIAQE